MAITRIAPNEAERFECWSGVITATITNPAMIWVCAQERLWYSVAALLSVFVLQTVLLQLNMKHRNTRPSDRMILMSIVVTTNILTYLIGQPIFESLSQSALSFAEIQVLLSVLFFFIGARSCVVRLDSPTTWQGDNNVTNGL